LIDADNIKYVVKNKGNFTEHDRVKNRDLIINKIKKFYKKDYIVIASFISPFKKDREYAKTFFKKNFYEIYVNAPIEVCKKRDPKGLYKKAENGELKNFIGVHINYEVPDSPDLVINSADASIEDCAAKIMKFIVEKILTGEK
jgi:adenylylsulfate kinase-like enzyme